MSEPLTCAEAEPLLPLVADGAIDPDSDPGLFMHLAGCADCQRAVASHDLIALAIARTPTAAPASGRGIIQLWPYAAAAGLAIAAGFWLVPGRPQAAPVLAAAPLPVPVAQSPAPVVAQQPPAAVVPAAGRDVIAVPRGDSTTLYLVRQGESWVPVDPANLDGPAQPGHGGGSGVQVRY